tara:strand:+ start:230 stop:682 length:453 start_codon:yes stop_codon:yes gene_type:complete
MITTEYFGSEIQDVQVEIEVRFNSSTGVLTSVRTFVFNQKILAQTFTRKGTQPANKPVPLSLSDVILDYTPILLQSGRGGPSVPDPYVLIRGIYRGYTFSDTTTYNPNGLTKVQSIGSISTSPAGDLIEVATTYNIICCAPTAFMTGTEK